MRLLLTGGAGFIGSRLIPALAEAHEVHALARSRPPATGGVSWIEHDLGDPLDESVLPAHVDAVVHLAQSRRYREFPDGASDVFAVNVRATVELLEYARRAGAERFVFASTGGLHGYRHEPPATATVAGPMDFYLASKYAAETLVLRYTAELRAIVLRLFFPYGPGQRSMLIPTLASRVTKRETITIQGEPGIRINPIYVDDVVRALEQALALDESLLCDVAGSEKVTVTELVDLLGELSEIDPVVVHASAAPTEDIVGDTERMQKKLGVMPAVPLREGLARVIAELGPG